MFSTAVQCSKDVLLHSNTMKRRTDCSVKAHVHQHGFRAAPYSCRSAVAVKLIINVSPGLGGLYDWQSCAEACRAEAGESHNQQNHSACQGAATVPDGKLEWNPGPCSTLPSPLLSGPMEQLYEGLCHQAHV